MSEEFKSDSFDKYILSLLKAKIVLWDYDVQGGVIINSFGLSVFFKESRASIKLDDWIKLIVPEDRDGVTKAVDSILKTGADEFSIEYRISAGDPGYTWIRTSVRVTSRDGIGNPVSVTGMNQDITEMKLLHEKSIRREQRLRDSESRLKNAMKLGRMSPWEYDFSSDSFITDRQMADVWGYAEYFDNNNPVSRDKLMEKIYPDDKEFVVRRFREAVSYGAGIDLSYRILSNGEIKYIHFISEVVYDENNTPVKLIGVAQDITGMKRLELSLAKNLEGLSFIADKIGLGLWEMEVSSGVICVLNYRGNIADGARYTGISLEKLSEMVHPDDLNQLKGRIDAHFSGKEGVIEAEVRLGDKEQYKWYHISSVVNRSDDNGKPVSIRGFYQDITERKEIESRLYQSQKMEAIGRLAGGVAHDFNNILQVILGYGSLSLMETENNTGLFQNISHIVDSADKAKNLVRQLLLFARKEKFNPVHVSVNDIINGLLVMLKRLISENINLSFIPCDSIKPIRGDAMQLEQVFLNICLNARDAISVSGSIIIRTDNISLEDPWPCFDNQIPAGSYVKISISDTGCGIGPDAVNHIFEPFYTTKEKNRGTGLGLATVYSIVKQHDGYIDVYSLKDKGSTFTLYFPVAETGKVDAVNEDIPSQAKKITGRGTIMLAEDDDLVRKYTSRILADSGYDVILAGDGEEAVELYKKDRDRINLLILDVVMPKINGWDVYNSIGGKRLSIPVIFFSGYDRDLLPPSIALKSNMRFIQKPFKYYTIIKAVHELID